jgi:flagellar hook-basal body complex protein FliE
MSIYGISAITNAMSGMTPIQGISTQVEGATSKVASSAGAGKNFADVLSGLLDDVQASQANANAVSQAAAAGKADPIEVLTATTEAQLTVQMATVVRNRAVEAFNEIMRMQV